MMLCRFFKLTNSIFLTRHGVQILFVLFVSHDAVKQQLLYKAICRKLPVIKQLFSKALHNSNSSRQERIRVYLQNCEIFIDAHIVTLFVFQIASYRSLDLLKKTLLKNNNDQIITFSKTFKLW